MENIAFKDISVVVQGPIVGAVNAPYESRYTKRCLDSIREHLPGAEIILSTWEGSCLEELSYDVVVTNKDPGGHIFHKEFKYYNNVNRQIVTTVSGLKKASRRYVVKIRSDMELLGSGFVGYFGKYTARNEEMSFLKERVLVPTVYTRNPRRIYPFPFHPSDWFYFGYLEDVLDIWDVPLADEPHLSRYFENHPKPKPDRFPYFLCRYFPEQYIWISFLNKHKQIDLKYFAENNDNVIQLSEQSIASNLVLLEPEMLQISFLKYNIKTEDWISLYTFGEWQRMYKKYCGAAIELSCDRLLVKKMFLKYIRFALPTVMLRNLLKVMLVAKPTLLSDWESRFPRSFYRVRKLFRFVDRF